MRLKRFLLVLLISLMCLSVPSFVFAVTDTESRVQEKLEAGLEVSNKSLTDRITTEEIAEIEAKYQTYLKQEEKYEIQIAESLRSSTGNEEMYNLVLSTEKEDKISAMKEMILFIKESPSIKEEHRNQFNSYISKYAPYVDEQFIREYYNTISVKSVQEYRKASNFNTLNNWSYNSTNAVNYALNNYNNYNSSYPNVTALGGDCANFVSQSLYAGGIPMNGSWYVYKKNSTYPSPQTVAELDHSWTLASPSPWISAKEFNAKWYPIFSNETFSGSYVYDNKSTIYNKSYYKGDVVQILKKNFWWYEAFHTMIITGYSNGDFTLSYHTTNTKDKALNSIASGYTSSNYQFIFYSVK